MSIKAYKCGKCGNWYTPVPSNDPEDICTIEHSSKAHCHYGEKPSTEAEVRTAEVCISTHIALEAAMGKSADAARFVQEAELATKRLPGILETADKFVFKNSGAGVSPGPDHWTNLRGMKEMVAMQRRPDTDVALLERSMRVSQSTAAEAVAELEHAKLLWQVPGVSLVSPEAVLEAVEAVTAKSVAAAKIHENKPGKPLIVCECGAKFRLGGDNFHKGSKVHKAWTAARTRVLATA